MVTRKSYNKTPDKYTPQHVGKVEGLNFGGAKKKATRCEAKTASGKRCKHMTTKGKKCGHHK